MPFQSRRRTASRSVMPGPEADEQPPDPVRGLARRVFQRRELVDLGHGAQAAVGVHQQVVGVLDQPVGPVRARSASTT